MHSHEVRVQWPVAGLRLFGHAGDGGVESHAGLDTDHQQVEDIGKRVDHLSLTDLDPIAEPKVGQEEADPREDKRDGQELHEGNDPNEDEAAVKKIGGPDENGQRDLGADEDHDGSRLIMAGPDEPLPVLRGSLFRAAEGAPDALDGALPACDRLVAPTKNGLFVDAVAGRRGQSAALQDRPQLEQRHRGQDRDTGDDDECEKDDGDRVHGCLTP